VGAAGTVGAMRDRWLVAAVVAVALSTVACAAGGTSADAPGTTTTSSTAPATTDTATAPAAPPTTAPDPYARPDWLGTRVLAAGPDGTAAAQPTPVELDPRQLATVDVLPPPADSGFHASVSPVPPDVAARSSWQPTCPVTLDELRYVTVSFRGFDGKAHTGELLVHRDGADGFVEVFRQLFDAGYPIEEMRITSAADIDAPPTGDGNNTSAFACRPTRGSTSWSSHAYGRAVDVNPFQNPYHSGERVLPELATSYLDRGNARPGMIQPGDVVVQGFGGIGWAWGGSWTRPIDYMHFSADNR
jgi:D-alanyl-D-alanine carboxypeptidase